MRLVEAKAMRAAGWGRMTSHRSEDRPLHAERSRRSWGVKEYAAMGPVVGLAEVASGEWRVTSWKKKQQVPRSADSSGTQKARCARNENARESRRTVRRFVEVGVIPADQVRRRAGSGGCSCR